MVCLLLSSPSIMAAARRRIARTARCSAACTSRRARRGDRDGQLGVSRQQGALCVKGWSASETLTHPIGFARRSSAMRRARLPLVPATWEDALERIARRLSRNPGAARTRRHRRVRRRTLTNEKAYLLGKFARVALGTVEHRLQRAVLHVVGRRGGDHGARHSTAGCRFRSRTSRRPTAILLAGANIAETMPPLMQYFEAQRAAAARSSSSIRGGRRRRRGPAGISRSGRAPMPRLPTACCTCSSATS